MMNTPSPEKSRSLLHELINGYHQTTTQRFAAARKLVWFFTGTTVVLLLAVGWFNYWRSVEIGNYLVAAPLWWSQLPDALVVMSLVGWLHYQNKYYSIRDHLIILRYMRVCASNSVSLRGGEK